MKIAIGCDHAGFALKDTILRVLQEAKHEVIDCGTNSAESVDFPDFGLAAAQKVAQGQADRAILICGSGVGMCLTANKVKGIRASVCHDSYSARQAVEHDNLNVLCLGARIIGPALAEELVKQFLGASFKAGTRHEKRLNKILAFENAHFK
ncbi:MAG: ribose 5-phosphate isomerase B [Elusimicrobiaceae bacterium]|nr:ribose 5-phosphate isomerase B [Elusimicrobiaceae bacterium]